MESAPRGYTATPELERELARRETASLVGGRYRATIARAGTGHYEAWTDSLPFAYGRAASTIQGALDALERAVLEVEAKQKTS